MFVDKATKERLHEIREAIKKYGFDKILGQTAKNKIRSKGDDEANFQKLCRLKGDVSGKEKPSLVVGALGSAADKEGEENGDETCCRHQKPIFLQSFIVYI